MSILVRVLKVILPVAVLGLASLVTIEMIRSQPDVETQPPPIAPPGVRVRQVNLDSVQTSVTSQGTVRPRTETQIVPEISGRVIWVSPSFASGGFFEQGDILLRIDPFDYEQAVVSARSQLVQARLRLAQEEAEAEVAQREWEALGLGDPRELTLRKPQLEEARASVAAAEANLMRSERDLERADVIAPYAGRVRTKNVDVGQFVTVGNAIASIYSVDVAEIRLPLPDEELAYLNLPLAYRGSERLARPRVLVRTTFGGSTYEWGGRIVRTESELDPVSRMVHIIAEVEDPYASGPDRNRPPLAVGMYVEAEIEGRTFSEIAILPRAALRGRNQVLVIDTDSRVRFREVDILRTTTESVYLRRGLSNGDRVVVSAIDNPTEGMFVQVTDLGTAPASASTRAEAPPESAARESSEDMLVQVTDLSTAPASASTRAEAPPESAARESSGGEQPAWLRELLAENRERGARAETAAEALLAPAENRERGARAETAAEALLAPPEHVSPPSNPAPSVTFEETLAESLGNTIAVRAFSTLSDMPEDATLGEEIVSTITEHLESLASVRVVPRESDPTWAIVGSIQRVGGVVRVTARLVDVRQGLLVRAIKVDGPIDQLGRLQDTVVAELRDSIREATS